MPEEPHWLGVAVVEVALEEDPARDCAGERNSAEDGVGGGRGGGE